MLVDEGVLDERIDTFIDRNGLFSRVDTVVVAVSGGLDSVALLDLLHRRDQPLVVVHVHHGLRGSDADADAALVRKHAEQRGLPCEVAHADVTALAERDGRSLEEAARLLRYRLLHEVAEQIGSRVVAAAHHRDDQAETVLLNLFRGTGLEGLAGMSPSRSLQPGSTIRLVRPLLEVGRDELEDYVRKRDLKWHQDATNDEVAFRRNALRHRVMPLVREHFGVAAPAKVAEAAALVRGYLDEQWRDELERRFVRCQPPENPGGRLGVAALHGQPGVWRGRIVLEALARWLPDAPQRASVVGEVAGLLDAQPGRRVELEGGDVWRERGVLRFVPARQARADASSTLQPGEAVEVAGTVVRAEVLTAIPSDLAAGAPDIVYLDAARLEWPLTVRIWQPGDRIRPLGMDGSRLVSDLLTDERVPPSERARQLVVVAAGEVGWVVGHRIAHTFRVTERTEQVVLLRREEVQTT